MNKRWYSIHRVKQEQNPKGGQDMIEAYGTSGEFYRTLDEVAEYIEAEGYYINEINDEYVSFSDNDDTEYIADFIFAGGTIIINSVEEA
jgi:hypothetical protein